MDQHERDEMDEEERAREVRPVTGEELAREFLAHLLGVVGGIRTAYQDQDVKVGRDGAGRVHVGIRPLGPGDRPGRRRARAAFN